MRSVAVRQILILLFALGSLMSTVTATAQEPGRLALLIGNQTYTQKVGPLKNPRKDVDIIAASLTKLGFKVTVLKDANYKTMETALKRYVNEVRRAGRGALSFFYYSGHGVANPDTQINYLIPVDITDADDDKVWFESLQQNEVIDLFSKQAPFATHYLVFDACRNELKLAPSGAKALGNDKGFVPLNDTSGLLIAYATAPRQTASDVGDDGGPYAKALAEELLKPGVEAVSMFRNVQILIKETIGQDPWLSFPSLPPIYFAGRAESAKSTQPPLPSNPASSEAERAWPLVKDTLNLAMLDAFIKRYGDTFYGDLARERRKELAQGQSGQQPTDNRTATDARAQEEANRQRTAMQQQRNDEKKSLEAEGSKSNAPDANTAHPARTFRDCPNCPEMVVVPAGEFVMGSAESEIGHKPNEGPLHKVTIKQALAVGKFEVTFAEWLDCAAGGGCAGNSAPFDEGWGRGKRPVIHVSWDAATEYVTWLSHKTGKAYRLLTEAEWEYAARGVTKASAPGTPFSTGATISTEQANYNGNFVYGNGKKGAYLGKTVEVGTFPPNAFGLHDMHGNVWEWVQDCYRENYGGAPADGTAVPTAICDFRILRGGAWRVDPRFLRSAYRHQGRPDESSDSYGFRVARPL
jgi:formylglycine-generating enzyme required for sulfatase activity